MPSLLRGLALAAVALASAQTPPNEPLTCDVCQLVVGTAQAIGGSSELLADLVGILDDGCSALFKNDTALTAACDSVAKSLADVLPWANKQINTLAWDEPLGVCSTLVPVCTNPCCESATLPEQLHLALTGAADEMSVTWVTAGSAANYVQWGLSGGPLNYSATGENRTYTFGGWVGVIHSAVMTGLLPGTAYQYQVGDPVAGAFSPVYTFNTLPANVGTLERPLRVLQIGDMGYGPNSDETVAQLTQEVQTAPGIDLLLHVGDIGYADGFAQHDDVFGRKVEPITAVVPTMVVPGNHEIWGAEAAKEGGVPNPYLGGFTAYKARYSMPLVNGSSNGSMYYSFNYGPVHFTMISTESALDTPQLEGDEQQWMQNDLGVNAVGDARKAAPWMVVGGHRPFYCTDKGNSVQCGTFAFLLRTGGEWAFKANNVDLVVTAHEHGWERTWPVYNNNVTQQNYNSPLAPVYIVNGAAGNREGNELAQGNQPWSAAQSGAVGYGKMEIVGGPGVGSGETIWMAYSFIASNGTVLDSFNITKTAP